QHQQQQLQLPVQHQQHQRRQQQHLLPLQLHPLRPLPSPLVRQRRITFL
ncbi:unnamed protein product, partial [Rotaria magnacalcarata]